MIWNPFRRNNSVDPDRNIVDQLASDLQDAGEVGRLEDELEKIKEDPLNEKEVESWHHLYGICAFQKGEHELASERFREGLKACPDSCQIKFSLAQEYIFLGRPQKAFPIFDDCLFPAVSREFTLAMSRYAYLFSEHERGINYLKIFFELYKEAKILDDHFLYVRGLPFFSTAWSHLAAHCALSGNEKKLRSITEDISNCCHDYEFDLIGAELEAVLNNDFGCMIQPLHSRLDEIRKYNGPTSYTKFKIALFESYLSKSYQQAMEKINSVVLTGSDFPWLEDIRTLAKAEAAHRFSHDSESALIDSFLENQSMLFEPDHAVSFGLLAYQEIIKPRVAIVAASACSRTRKSRAADAGVMSHGGKE